MIIPEYELKSAEYRTKKQLHIYISCMYSIYVLGLLVDIYNQLRWGVVSQWWWQEIMVVLIGLYSADFVTGLIHVYLDNHHVVFNNIHTLNFASAKLNRVAYAFQYSHHVNPCKMIEGLPITATDGQLEILLYLATPTLIASKVMMITFLSWGEETRRLIVLGNSIFILFAMSSQIFHAYAHLPKSKVPFCMRLLQSTGIILSNAEHLKHHKRNEYFFSIVNGWSNPLLNKVYDHFLKPLFLENN